jgi:hypothetical protein
MANITLYGSHDSYEDGSIPFTRNFRVLKNAILIAVQDESIDEVVFKSGSYSYSFISDLGMLRMAYKNRMSTSKPLWELWLKRLEAIERCEYP